MLHLHVHTRATLWFGFLGFIGRSLRALVLLALVAAAITGAGYLLKKGFYENDEFRLQAIDLNQNPALDERRLMEMGSINAHGSIFSIDIGGLEAKLRALPELREVSVRRNLPGNLIVRVEPREPCAWVEWVGDGRRMLVDEEGVAFPCTLAFVRKSQSLPVLLLRDPQAPSGVPGKKVVSDELMRMSRLLKVAQSHPAADAQWRIQTIEQANRWSLLLTTNEGVKATFGLGDHDRQWRDFVTSLQHATKKGYELATINLIPERNIPVTLRSEAPPRAVPVEEPPKRETKDRKGKDLQSLLNRG